MFIKNILGKATDFWILVNKHLLWFLIIHNNTASRLMLLYREYIHALFL